MPNLSALWLDTTVVLHVLPLILIQERTDSH